MPKSCNVGIGRHIFIQRKPQMRPAHSENGGGDQDREYEVQGVHAVTMQAGYKSINQRTRSLIGSAFWSLPTSFFGFRRGYLEYRENAGGGMPGWI